VINAFLQLPSCLQFDKDPKACISQVQKLLELILLKSSRGDTLHHILEEVQTPMVPSDVITNIMEFTGDVLPNATFRLPKVRFAKHDAELRAQIMKVQRLFKQLACLEAPLVRVVV